MRTRFVPFIAAIAIALTMFVPAPAGSWSEWQFYTLYRFAGGNDGALSNNTLIGDAAGALYGVSAEGGNCGGTFAPGCGTVFKLAPPPVKGAPRQESVLYSFVGGADGANPNGALAADAGGSLYGVTQHGGAAGFGTIYELTPAPGGTYTERVLYAFSGGSDGKFPTGALVLDAAGDLFGTAQEGGVGFGTVFELAASAPQNGGRRTIGSRTAAPVFETLYSFTSGNGNGLYPNGGLLDLGGAFYGVTTLGGVPGHNYGTVFEVSPPAPGATTWTERIVYAFRSKGEGRNGVGPLLLGGHGTLYGTTREGGAYCGNPGCGTVFKLTPPARGATNWTERVLYSFGQFFGGTKFAPGYVSGGLVADGSGRLYGTASSGGTGGYGAAFRLTPDAGGSTYSETDLVDFSNGKTGAGPVGGLFRNGSSLYGTTQAGGAGFGTIYQLRFE